MNILDISELKIEKNTIHVPEEVIVDHNKGLAEYFFESFNKYSDRICQIDSTTEKKETYKEVLDRIICLAQALKTKGIKSDDVVAYCCYNNMDYLVSIMATVFIGAKFTGIDNIADKREIAHCLKIVKPKLIFCDKNAEELVESGMKIAEISCDVIVYTKSEKNMSVSEFIDKYKTNEKFEIYKDKVLRDTACIVFTSGTTGLVKGAEISGFGLYHAVTVSKRLLPDVKTLMVFTLTSWISNLAFITFSTLYGLTRVIYKAFEKENFIKITSTYQVDLIMLTQHIMTTLLKHPEYCCYDTSSVKYILFGGTMIGKNTLTEINKLYPNGALMNCYAMTETGGIVFLCPTDGKDYFDSNGKYTVGYPCPGLIYKIVDVTTEENLGPNQQGELRIKYDGLMNQYYNDPEKTVEVFDKDGFLKTGDIAYYNEKYMFFVIDRLKEIFKYEGRSLSPVIIEDTLLKHPAVEEVAVITVPHEKGEVPLACIVLRDNETAKEEEFVKFIEERLSYLYHLRGGVKFIESIPKTTRGKIRRNILKEQIHKELGIEN